MGTFHDHKQEKGQYERSSKIYLVMFEILREIADEFKLKLSVVFVCSDRNKADALTKVRKHWLKAEEDTAVVCCVEQEEAKELHNLHHVGVDRTLYLIQKVGVSSWCNG